MAVGIKAYSVSATPLSVTPVTVYTVGAGKVAKVILSSLSVEYNNGGTLRLDIGVVRYTISPTSSGPTARYVINTATSDATGVASTKLFESAPEIYLNAGQTVAYSGNGTNQTTLTMQIGVIEETAL